MAARLLAGGGLSSLGLRFRPKRVETIALRRLRRRDRLRLLRLGPHSRYTNHRHRHRPLAFVATRSKASRQHAMHPIRSTMGAAQAKCVPISEVAGLLDKWREMPGLAELPRKIQQTIVCLKSEYHYCEEM